MTATRRLTAIMAADVAGYSRLMGADEEVRLAGDPHQRAAFWPKFIQERHITFE